ncbi:MAG: hypothetical protein ACYCVE_08935 [Gemmatimonadaceae bacterium]
MADRFRGDNRIANGQRIIAHVHADKALARNADRYGSHLTVQVTQLTTHPLLGQAFTRRANSPLRGPRRTPDGLVSIHEIAVTKDRIDVTWVRE